MKIKKNKLTCLICGAKNTNTKLEYNMPIFMGTVDKYNNQKDLIECMNFDVCSKCGNVQIKSEINSSLLYKENHNIGIIGNVWKQHYNLFFKFLSPFIKNKNIIEISDPSAKLAKMANNFSSWTIIEPNPDFLPTDKIQLIRDYFGDEFNTKKQYDVIIHSHFMEHCSSVHNFLKKCNSLLVDHGIMIFSIPNLKLLLNVCTIPNNILHFEHTYFFDENTIKYLLNKNGFVIQNIKRYKNHSIFYKCKKATKSIKTNIPKHNKVLINKFKKLHKMSVSNIKNINKKLLNTTSEIYLFGAHVNSQYYIYNGLKQITGIIDNSPSKQNKRLYGTNYIVYPADVIKNKKNPVVICSSVGGPYKKEIMKQLVSLNKNVSFL
jgi:hypothetical protein